MDTQTLIAMLVYPEDLDMQLMAEIFEQLKSIKEEYNLSHEEMEEIMDSI